MPGAGSMKAANYIYQVAPKDGTALGVIVESAALEQVLGNTAAQYDAAKFTYVGRVATSNNVFMQWHTSKVQSIADSQRIESTLAGTGPGSIAETIPRLFNAIIGTKFRLVSGYPASTEGMLAMERGEVEGASSSWAAVFVAKQNLLREKKIRIILQTQPERHQDLPDAPSVTEYGNTPEDRQVTALYASGSGVGRSLLGPPGIPDRPPEDLARRVQRDGQGSRLRRRHQEAQRRARPAAGRARAGADHAHACRPRLRARARQGGVRALAHFRDFDPNSA